MALDKSFLEQWGKRSQERETPSEPQKTKKLTAPAPLNGSSTERLKEHALKVAADIIAGAADGQKHGELLKAANLLGGYVGGNILSFAEAEAHLQTCIRQKANVADLKQADKTIADGLNHGQGQPITKEMKEAERAAWLASNGKRPPAPKLPETPGQWPEPESLRQALPPVEPLSREMMPEALQKFVFDVAHRMQCPPDYVAAAAIVGFGSLLAAKCGIRPKQKDNWLVVPNLYGCIVGKPSTLKSPAIAEIFRQLDRLAAEAMETYQQQVAEYEADKEVQKAAKDAIKKKLGQLAAKGENCEGLKRELAGLNAKAPDAPALKRYKTNDATVEKLCDLLAENPEGFLVFRDELAGLLNSWEKQGRETDRAFYLEAWNGNSSHTVDRVMKGTAFIKRLCLSVFGGIQPDKLAGYMQKFTGMENDGMLQRFQVMVCPDEPKGWQYVDSYPDKEARDRVFKLVQGLATFQPESHGATVAEYEVLPYFHFADAAQMVFREWITELETRKLRNSELPPIMQEHLAKYRSLMPSLALIFHCIDILEGEPVKDRVSRKAAEMAVKWCNYLESHAQRVYNGLPGQRAAFELSKKLSEGKLQSPFTARDVQRKGWNLLTDRKVIADALAELVETGWLLDEPRENQSPGRPKATQYHINPKAHKFYSNA